MRIKSGYIVVLMLLCVSRICGQQSRALGEFSKVEVTDKIHVQLVASDRNYMEVEGGMMDKFELVQQADQIRFKMASGYPLQGKDLHITLHYRVLESVVVRKGAVVDNTGSEVLGDSIYLSANEGGKIALRLHVDKLGSFATTGGSITLEGEAKSQQINIAVGGLYYAKNALSDTVTATVRAGGKCEVNVSTKVDLQLLAGGVIDVYGNPKDRKVSKIAGGKINYRD